MNSAVLFHTSSRAAIRRTQSEPLARVLTYPHFGGPIPYAIDMSNIKTPISKYFLAHLASLVQARTVLNGEVQQERRARPCRGPLDVPINAVGPPLLTCKFCML